MSEQPNDWDVIGEAISFGRHEHDRASGDGPNSGHQCVGCHRFMYALEALSRLRTQHERDREALCFDPDDIHVQLEDDDFGPSTITVYLSGSKQERSEQVNRFRAALSSSESIGEPTE